jgi:molecular chaperone HscA
VQVRKLAEARVDAESIVTAVLVALESDGDLIDANERAQIDAAISALQTASANNDADAILAATEQLNAATGDFASRRMDAAVKRGLAGHKIADI